MGEIISVRNLDKIYLDRHGNTLYALKDVTLAIRDEEFVAIVGRSGCGKTTLLKIIAGLLPYERGSVFVREKKVDLPVEGVGMVFQTPTLLPWRKNLQNVLLPIEMMGKQVKDYLKAAYDLFEMTGLKGFEERYPFELSGGMQQRVSICRSLIHDPQILLMDEPFGALDALTRDDLNIELLRLWDRKKKTVIFVTHSIPEAVFLSDRVLVMGPRPGTVIHTEEIELPRPRNLETRSTEKYSQHLSAIREKIGIEEAGPE